MENNENNYSYYAYGYLESSDYDFIEQTDPKGEQSKAVDKIIAKLPSAPNGPIFAVGKEACAVLWWDSADSSIISWEILRYRLLVMLYNICNN